MKSTFKILAVDDEPFNLDIIITYLEGDGYEVLGAKDGNEALALLEKHEDIDVIVLDRMMPRMDGMAVLKKVKSEPKWQEIPVIMQTAASSTDQVLKGIQEGVYYYLTKPYEDVMLLSIVKSAIHDHVHKTQIKQEVGKHQRALGMMEQACFRFRTLEEAKNLSYFIANCSPNPRDLVYGINELLINAIEHGNLGITYAEKTALVLQGRWQEEVERRIMLAENKEKFAHLRYEATDTGFIVHIQDQGPGFDWQPYLEISPQRITDPHGRGIATAKTLSFTTLEYLGSGNEVRCTVVFPTA
jgi:CheY-like chemotaxis protein